MRKKSLGGLLTEIFSVLTISFTGVCGIIFCVLYAENFATGFIKDNSDIVNTVIVTFVSVCGALSVVFLRLKRKLLFRITVLFILTVTAIMFGVYYFKKSGFADRIKSINDFRNYIAEFGESAVFYFILLQFLQVVIIPIPSFITVGAGVLLFGAFRGAVYSCVGIIAGSLAAFFIGRLFGAKTIEWVIGREKLRAALNSIKGKDKIVLTFMFLFPFFPDDLLCFVAGITTVGGTFFCVMIVITRIITVFASSYSFGNRLIPFDTWWGVLLWIVFFIATACITKLIVKYGDRISLKIKETYEKNGRYRRRCGGAVCGSYRGAERQRSNFNRKERKTR